jgi:tRNA(Ile)-lysidine synthase
MSGGADSAALALVLQRLAAEFEMRVDGAHYDHGIRAAASREAERATVREQCARLGMVLHEGGAAPGELRERRRASGRSLEELARERRYAFLLAVAARHGAAAVAVGHHLDDNLETILMRALQGSLRGGGIAVRSGPLLRPLLGVRRAVLRRSVAAAGLPVAEDPTNADPGILRNRIRELMPALEAAVPGTARNLPLLAHGGAAAGNALAARARRDVPWRYVRDARRGVHYRVAAGAFWSAPREVRQAALYQVWDAVTSRGLSARRDRPRLPRRFLQPLLAAGGAPRRLQVAGHGVCITCGPRWVVVARRAAPATPAR